MLFRSPNETQGGMADTKSPETPSGVTLSLELPLGEGLASPLAPLPSTPLQPTQQKTCETQHFKRNQCFGRLSACPEFPPGPHSGTFINKLRWNFTFWGLCCFAREVWRCMSLSLVNHNLCQVGQQFLRTLSLQGVSRVIYDAFSFIPKFFS